MKSAKKSQIISISLPPDMTAEVQDMAKEERRSVSEVIREALRQYGANRDLKAIRKEGSKKAKARGIKPEDVVQMVHESRK